MSVKMPSIALLLLLACLCVHPAAGRHAGKKRSPCCTGFSTKDVSSEVTGNTYREQAAGGHCVKAVIFTADDGQICANPKDDWVQKLTANMTKV